MVVTTDRQRWLLKQFETPNSYPEVLLAYCDEFKPNGVEAWQLYAIRNGWDYPDHWGLGWKQLLTNDFWDLHGAGRIEYTGGTNQYGKRIYVTVKEPEPND